MGRGMVSETCPVGRGLCGGRCDGGGVVTGGGGIKEEVSRANGDLGNLGGNDAIVKTDDSQNSQNNCLVIVI